MIMKYYFKAAAHASLVFLTLMSLGTAASAQEYVEFLMGDRTEETRKWSHVSLRVVTGKQDMIFDFGRYGRMWGKRNASEGELLRVWKKAMNFRDLQVLS